MSLESMISDLAEEDYVGLWELVWRAQTVLGRDVPKDLVAQLRHHVQEMIGKGAIMLFRGHSFTGEEQLITGDQVAQSLANLNFWKPPGASDIHVRIITSNHGKTG